MKKEAEASATPVVVTRQRKKESKPRRQKSSEAVQSLSIQKTPSEVVPVNPIQQINGWITTAMASNRTMEDIQKFIDMRNAEIARLAELEFKQDLSEFLKICPPITKNKRVQFDHKDGHGKTDYQYTQLAFMLRIVKEPASHLGFSWQWFTRYEGKDIFVCCVLSHRGGHYISDEMKGSADTSGKKNEIQANTSTISYLRRATLKGLLGLAEEDEDNDGQDGGAVPINQERQKSKRFNFDSVLQAVKDKKITALEAEETYDLTAEQIETIRLF